KKRRGTPSSQPTTQGDKQHRPSVDGALDLVMKTLQALRAERGDDYPIRASLVKEAIKRQHPGFNERAHGFRAFNDLLLEAQQRTFLKLKKVKNAASYVARPTDYPRFAPRASGVECQC